MLNFEVKIKTNSLLISLKALDLYFIDFSSKEHLNISYKYSEIINDNLKLGNYHIHPKYYHKCYIEDSVKTTYLIKQLLKDNYIQNIIKVILRNYSDNKSCDLTDQYIKKFHFLYNNTNMYYHTFSYYLNNSNKEIAITNIYILYKITQDINTYQIIKYLCL